MDRADEPFPTYRAHLRRTPPFAQHLGHRRLSIRRGLPSPRMFSITRTPTFFPHSFQASSLYNSQTITMKFILAASALAFAGFASAQNSSTPIYPSSLIPPPPSSSSTNTNSLGPTSRYPPPPPYTTVVTTTTKCDEECTRTHDEHHPYHPTILPICDWCIETVTCMATEWVPIGCTTLEVWTKCALPPKTWSTATMTVIYPCTTEYVPVSPIVVYATQPYVTPPYVTPVYTTPGYITPVYTTPVHTTPRTLPVFVSGGSVTGLRNGAIAGAAVAIAAAIMCFV
jgi:hypothetical protein